MYPWGHWEHDSWEGRLPPPSPPRGYRHVYRNSEHLSPDPGYHGLHRSHSQGHVPRGASIHIHNEIPVNQDTHARADSRGPPMAPMPPPPQQVPMMPPPVQQVPMMRPQPPMFIPVYPDPAQELIAEQLAELRMHRSRSRGRSTGERPPSAEWYRWELAQREKEAAASAAAAKRAEELARLKTEYELQQREKEAAAAAAAQKRNEEAKRITTEMELKAAEEEANRRRAEADAAAERKRLIDEYERKREEDARKAKEAEAAFKLKLQLQAQEEQEREEQAYKDYLRKQREREEEEERKYKEFLRKQQEKADAEEKKYHDFLRKQKEKAEEEDRKKKAEEAKINAAMKERLEKAGYSAKDIEVMLDPEKAEKKRKKRNRHSAIDVIEDANGIVMVPPPLPDAPGAHGPHGAIVLPESKVPVFPRINRTYLDIETLNHYNVPWEFDRANHDYIVILREMDKYETDVLFAHTARRRKNIKLLTEDTNKKKEPRYAWVRRTDRSKSRGRDLRVMEIKRY